MGTYVFVAAVAFVTGFLVQRSFERWLVTARMRYLRVKCELCGSHVDVLSHALVVRTQHPASECKRSLQRGLLLPDDMKGIPILASKPPKA